MMYCDDLPDEEEREGLLLLETVVSTTFAEVIFTGT